MLGKLLKYEVKATARWFIPLYTALLLFTLINRFLINTDSFIMEGAINLRQIATVLSIFVYVFLFVGIMVVTFVVVIQRFYKSLLGDEGYLMFTLPVQTWKHIMSKLLIAMLWNFMSAFIGFCSILFLISSQDVGEITHLFTSIQDYFGLTGYVTLPLFFLVTLVFGVIEMYAAIALGHQFSKHKLLASFGMYVGINTLSQMAFIVVMPFFMNTLITSAIHNTPPTPAQLNMLFLLFTLILAAMTAGCYIVTHILLKKKLNLE